MRVNCVVEKGSDGLFAVYSEDHIGKSYFDSGKASARQKKISSPASVKPSRKNPRQETRSRDLKTSGYVTIMTYLPFSTISISSMSASLPPTQESTKAKCGHTRAE